MRKTSRILNNALTKQIEKLSTEFEAIISRMQSYEVTAFYSDLHSSYGEYSKQYFDELTFKEKINKVYSVDLDIPEVKEEVFDNILEYSRIVITLNTLRDFIKINDIDLGDTE